MSEQEGENSDNEEQMIQIGDMMVKKSTVVSLYEELKDILISTDGEARLLTKISTKPEIFVLVHFIVRIDGFEYSKDFIQLSELADRIERDKLASMTEQIEEDITSHLALKVFDNRASKSAFVTKNYEFIMDNLFSVFNANSRANLFHFSILFSRMYRVDPFRMISFLDHNDLYLSLLVKYSAIRQVGDCIVSLITLVDTNSKELKKFVTVLKDFFINKEILLKLFYNLLNLEDRFVPGMEYLFKDLLDGLSKFSRGFSIMRKLIENKPMLDLLFEKITEIATSPKARVILKFISYVELKTHTKEIETKFGFQKEFDSSFKNIQNKFRHILRRKVDVMMDAFFAYLKPYQDKDGSIAVGKDFDHLLFSEIFHLTATIFTTIRTFDSNFIRPENTVRFFQVIKTLMFTEGSKFSYLQSDIYACVNSFLRYLPNDSVDLMVGEDSIFDKICSYLSESIRRGHDASFDPLYGISWSLLILVRQYAESGPKSVAYSRLRKGLNSLWTDKYPEVLEWLKKERESVFSESCNNEETLSRLTGASKKNRLKKSSSYNDFSKQVLDIPEVQRAASFLELDSEDIMIVNFQIRHIEDNFGKKYSPVVSPMNIPKILKKNGI